MRAGSPDSIQERLAREDPPGVADERDQQPELESAELELDALTPRLASPRVDFELPGPVDGCRLRAGAAQCRLDAGPELAGLNGFVT